MMNRRTNRRRRRRNDSKRRERPHPPFVRIYGDVLHTLLTASGRKPRNDNKKKNKKKRNKQDEDGERDFY